MFSYKMVMTHKTHVISRKVLMMKAAEVKKRYMCLKLHINPLYIVWVSSFIITQFLFSVSIYQMTTAHLHNLLWKVQYLWKKCWQFYIAIIDFGLLIIMKTLCWIDLSPWPRTTYIPHAVPIITIEQTSSVHVVYAGSKSMYTCTNKKW